MLDRLRAGTIVSVQAHPGSALDDPSVLAAMALAAQEGGAAAVRIQGVANLEAVRARVSVPVIGIVKREYEGFEPYITPTLREVREVLGAGADIVAFDATGRPHPEGAGVGLLVEAIQEGGALAMADCATGSDGVCAEAAAADILATTLCGYTKETRQTPLPALGLVAELAGLETFVICEGGIQSPAQAAAALQAGADAVVVGTAITNIEWVVRQYVSSLAQRKSWPG